MSKLKVFLVPVIQQTILNVKVVAKSAAEAAEIVQDERCEWWHEKEEVLDSKFKSPKLYPDYWDTQYAYYRDSNGVVHSTQIENILKKDES